MRERARLASAATCWIVSAACSSSEPRFHLEAEGEAAPALRAALADLAQDLERLGLEPAEDPPSEDEPCVEDLLRVRVYAPTAAETERLGAEGYELTEERCGGQGRRLDLRAGGLLSSQWAVYEVAKQLGVRYFHPEQTFHPEAPRWPESFARVEKPAFMLRYISVHRTHPVELSAPLDADPELMALHQRRWVDWCVKNRMNYATGFDHEFVGSYAYDRGFPRRTGFNLLNSQQGMRPVIDPDDPRAEEEQIRSAIERVMGEEPELPAPSYFGFQFNPSEFTEADDQATVRRLEQIAGYFQANHPEVLLFTINHGTAGEPTPHHGLRFFDLPKLAPPNLGVQIHSLMFYDLDRPAPVYGNQDFRFLLDFARTEAPKRRIVHYPESSWWLTFDLPVPLYLAPVTIDARQRDVDLLRDLLSTSPADPTGVYGHQLFSSGQEWGYWLIDWCFAEQSWSLANTGTRCFEDFASIFRARDVVLEVLEAVRASQVEDLRDPEILRYLVGSDRETELALEAGIDFHPLPPGPAAVLNLDDAGAAALEVRSLRPLERIRDTYHRHADRLEAVLSEEPEAARPWLEEVVHGLRIFALRAEHGLEIYRTAVALRAALAARDLQAVGVASAGLDRARALTEEARAIVRVREASYRYPPALTIAGDEPGAPGARPNRTIYPYRYLSRTHRMFYWERPNQQLAELFGEGLELVRVSHRVMLPSERLSVSLLEEAASLLVDWGEGSPATTLEPKQFSAEGLYPWTLDAELSRGVLHHEDEVAVVGRRFVFKKGDVQVESPAGAELIDGFLPGFEIGLGDDGRPFLVVGRIDDRGELAARGSLERRAREGLSSPAAPWSLSLSGIGPITLDAASFTLDASSSTARVIIDGQVESADIVALVVSVGGFDLVGAKKIVAEALGYSAETLPATLRFRVLGRGREIQP